MEVPRVRAVFVVAICLAALAAAPPTGAYAQREGPAAVTAVQWDAGTLLSWTPSLEEDAIYHLYRGTSVDDLVRIARTSTPAYYDFKGDAGDKLVYAVTIVIDGEESKPTYLTVHGTASCVTAGMNGSVVVRPYNCLPLS